MSERKEIIQHEQTINLEEINQEVLAKEGRLKDTERESNN